jgi:hypothetical protein
MRYSKVIDPPSEATERNGEVLCRQTQPRIVPGKSSLSRIFHSDKSRGLEKRQITAASALKRCVGAARSVASTMQADLAGKMPRNLG